MTASLVIPNLYIGSAPPLHQSWSGTGIKHLVLAAREMRHLQPPANFPGVQVHYAPLDDDYNRPMPPTQVAIAMEAAQQVAQWVGNGETTVVTCHEGRNRSGLITALSLMLLTGVSPERAVRLLRAARGEMALQNPQFLKVLSAAGSQRPMAS